MKQNETKKKKGSPILTAIFLAIIGLVYLSDELPSGTMDVFIGLIALVIPVVLVIVLVRTVVKKAKVSEQTHTHDRIDHSSDVQIDAKTGKVSGTPVRTAQQHSAKEHWKQQLDGLLANGTIDRAEYRALMKRKF